MDLPLVGQFPTEPQPDAGVDPGIAVEPGVADMAAGRDVEIDAMRAASEQEIGATSST